jgi:hypothetical protein
MRLLASQGGLGSMKLCVRYNLVIGFSIKFHEIPSVQNEFVMPVWENGLTFVPALLQSGPVLVTNTRTEVKITSPLQRLSKENPDMWTLQCH